MSAGEAIAIVGMGCRFPGSANSPAEFWDLLARGGDGIVAIPRERWSPAAAPGVPPYAGLLDDIAGFDPEFFSITVREALALDPQQRFVLEVAWEAAEDAGIAARDLRDSRTGVFIGATGRDYAARLQERRADVPADAYHGSGNSLNFIAGRLAYTLGLRGPALSVDTACSSSLTALHLAIRSLRNGESDLAFAGGVNLILDPEISRSAHRSNLLSPDGRCNTFDRSANGIVRGEGCGVILLMRLEDARAQRRAVRAIIRGSAINQDGASSGLMTPRLDAQVDVIRDALRDAGIGAGEIDYVEAHGTGTSLGDPIELRALGAVFASQRPDPLRVGSVKTNIGHLESAAGIAGVIKVVLSLERETLPAHLRFSTPTPYVDWPALRLRVVSARESWERGDAPLRAGVSSFGGSGSNAHVVLEQAPREQAVAARSATTQLLLLSARSERSLAASRERWSRRLSRCDDPSEFAGLCAKAAVGRNHFAHRWSGVAQSPERMRALLSAPDAGRAQVAARQVDVAFLFTGQGAQYAGMGRELYETRPAFRAAFESLRERFTLEVGVAPDDLLWGAASGQLRNTRYTQPATFLIQYCLLKQWEAWDILPDVVLGHSVGEFAAACAAGVIDAPDALFLAAARGRLMEERCVSGGMLVVMAEPRELQDALRGEPQLSLSSLNAPRQTVIGGPRDALERLRVSLQARRLRCHALEVSHAFHTSMMAPMLDEFARLAANVALRPPRLTMISSVTGAAIEDDIADPDYWVRHVREPVRFADALGALASCEPHRIVEVGAGNTLLGLAQQNGLTMPGCMSMQSGREGDCLLEAAGTLYLGGAPLRCSELFADAPRNYVDAPGYVFDRERILVDSADVFPPGNRSDIRDALSGSLVRQTWVVSDAGKAGGTGRSLVLFAGRNPPRVGLVGGLEMLRIDPSAADFDSIELSGASEAHGLYLLATDSGEGSQPDEFARKNLRDWARALDWWERKAPGRPFATLIYIAAEPDRSAGGREWAAAAVRAAALTCAIEARACPVSIIEVPDGVWMDAQFEEALCRSPEAVRDEPCLRWMDGGFRAPRFEAAPRRFATTFRPRDTVLITGGVGALGLALCERLVQDGSGPIVLMSRRSEEQLDAATASRLTAMRAHGARIDFHSVDVSDRAALELALSRIRAAHPPLRSVFHTAGLFEADTLALLAGEGRLESFAAKAGGAWSLHELTTQDPIERFVLASSAAVNWGTPGHLGYAAANACLDALARCRRAQGLPASSIQFGPIASHGMASGARAAAIDASGLRRLDLDVAVEAMISLDSTDTSAPIVVDAEWSRFADALATRHSLRWFEPLVRATAVPDRSAGRAAPGVEGSELQALRALHPTLRLNRVCEICRGIVADVMRKDSAQSLAMDQPIQQWGVDSVLALEIRERLSVRLELPLPASLIFEYPTLRSLGQFIHEQCFGDVVPTLATSPAAESDAADEIAIVGIGCRFPGSANDAGQFWSNLLAGVDGIVDSPADRFAPGYPVGLMDDVEHFDAAFFGINPREARLMDPQQRVVLETCWHALEHANISPAALHGSSTGVFLGVADNDYLTLLRQGNSFDDDAAYLGTGSKLSVIPGRVSYFFGFEGPSLALDTACSSSAVAIHTACQSLRTLECDHALAGGVNVILDPLGFDTARRAKMLAADGRCKTFDAAADGYVRAEGCGVLVLKRLADAIRDDDDIVAVIKGSAVNQDGRSSSLTAPNPQAQIRVIEAAARNCDTSLACIDYVEAHGTGTSLGDPIELKALARAYGAGRDADRRLLVGGVKSQIGHTESAAGVAGIIKLALSLERGILPPTLHHHSLNPEAAACLPVLQVVDRTTPWPDRDRRRIGAVSSFGFSGTNAHLILAQAPRVIRNSEAPLPVLCVSAATTESLRRASASWLDALASAGSESWRGLLAASQHGRWHGPERICVIGSTRQDLIAGLEAAAAGADHACVLRGRVGENTSGYALGQHRNPDAHPTLAAALATELREIDVLMSRAGADAAAMSSWRAWPTVLLDWALLKRLRAAGVGVTRLVSDDAGVPIAAWAAGVIDERDLPSLLLGRAGKLSATPSCAVATCEIGTYHGVDLTQSVTTAEFWRDWQRGRVSAPCPEAGAELVSLRTVATALQAAGADLPDAALLAVAHCGGLRCAWPARGHPRARGPKYSFERRRFWCHDGPVLATPAATRLARPTDEHYLLGSMQSTPRAGEVEFNKRISAAAPAYVNDHRLLETMVVPAASHMSMLLSAWRELGRPYPCCIQDVRLVSPMVLRDGDERQMRISLQPRGADAYEVVLRSQQIVASPESADWITHATCVLRALHRERPAAPVSFAEIEKSWDGAVASEEFYEHFRRHGYTLGPSFRWLGEGWTRDGATVRRVHVAAPRDELEKVELHAGLIDTSFSVRSSGQMEWVRHFDSEHMAIPVAIEQLEFYGWSRPHGESWIHAQTGGLTVLEEGRLREDICLCEAEGIVARVTGFETRRARRDVLRLGASEVHRDWLFCDVWVPAGSRVTHERKKAIWVIVPSGGERTDALREAIAGEGRPHVFTELAAAGDSPEIARLLEASAVDVWIVDEHAAGARPSSDPFAGLLAVMRHWPAIARRLSAVTASVTLITRGAFAARPSDPPPRDAAAALAAFAAGLMVEHEDLSPRVLDLDPAATDAGAESRALCDTLARLDAGESRVAMRGDSALALRLERYRPPAAPASSPPASDTLRHIITGGLGGIGTRLAQSLLRGGARCVQLISRRIPDADAWAGLQAEALRLGARVELIEADVADAAIVALLADDARGIATIYHAAGAIDDELVVNMDEERQRRVLRGKWGGALNLAELARRRPPRALCFFSSWAASMPGAGQAMYAAANAAVDAIASQLSAEGVNARSVRFGPWRDAGMSSRLGESFLMKARTSGVIAFGVDQVLRILERLEHDPLAVPSAASIDWPAYLQSRPQWARSPYLGIFHPATQTTQATGSELLARLRLALPMARHDVLMSELREIVARTLGLSDAGLVEPERRLFDLGMDSIAAMELRDVLASLLDLKLRSTLLLDHSTLAALSRYLLELLFPRAEAVTRHVPRRGRDVEAMSEQEAELALLAELKH